MVHHLKWDVDGTLFDTYLAFTRAFHLALKDLGHHVPLEWIAAQTRVSMDFCVNALAERCHLAADVIGDSFDYHYRSIVPQEQPPFEGVVEICKFIVVNGGKNVIVTHRHSEGLASLLDTFEMRQYFSGWTTADDGY